MDSNPGEMGFESHMQIFNVKTLWKKGFKFLLNGFEFSNLEMHENTKKYSTNIYVHTSCTSIMPNSFLILQN